MSKEQQKPKTPEEEARSLKDEELLSIIKTTGSELARRRRAAIDAEKQKPYSKCRGCGYTFTKAQHEEYLYCPMCGGTNTELIRE